MSNRMSFTIGLILLIGASMACTLASSATDTPTPAPTSTMTPPPTNTPPVIATVGPTIRIITNTIIITAIATDTPTPTGTTTSTPTPTSTTTPTPTSPAPKPKPTTAVPTPAATNALLSISYEVQGVKRNPGNQAVVTLHVIATGGSGGYKYYNDGILQSDATFDVLGTCSSPLAHTLKVTSADGQSVSLTYFVRPTCPTPTATPTS